MMMKNHRLLRGSSAGLAAVIHGATVGFLVDRQQVIDLAPVTPESNAGYVWRRVFLKGKARG